MRSLTRQQRSALNRYIAENNDKLGLRFEAKDLPYDLFMRLKAINDYETLYQDITCYVVDHLD